MSVHSEKIAQLKADFDAAAGGDAAGLEAKLQAIKAGMTAADTTQADVMAVDDLELRLEVMQQKPKPREHK